MKNKHQFENPFRIQRVDRETFQSEKGKYSNQKKEKKIQLKKGKYVFQLEKGKLRKGSAT